MKNKKWLIGVCSLSLVFASCIHVFNTKNNVTVDTKKYNSFINELSEFTESIDENIDIDLAKSEIVGKVLTLNDNYGSANGVTYISSKLVSTTYSDEFENTAQLLNAVSNDISNYAAQSSLFGKVLTKDKTVTMKSNSVCEKLGSSSKHCVNLSANIYISDPNSTNWVVLVHPFMLDGSSIANAVGSMYTSKGVNVIAPDLRGFGNSEGSVAMGYLESLDIWDWIVNLNNNYSSMGAKSKPTGIIVHGVSLGAATTIQLWTQANQGRDLAAQNVKGLVDDCGYTSMKGIITGMLTGGSSTSQITNFLQQFGLNSEQISGIVNNLLPKLNSMNIQKSDEIEKIKDSINGIGSSISGSLSGALSGALSGIMGGINNNLDSIVEGIKQKFEVLKDDLIENALIDLVGVGLQKGNDFDVNQDAFHSSRVMSNVNKILVIHGTADTMVPHSNSKVVKTKAGSKLSSQSWDPAQPHAFIIMGSEKDEYESRISNFVDEVLTVSKPVEEEKEGLISSIGKTISNVFSKIANFFKSLFK